MKIEKIRRQGDLLLVKVDSIDGFKNKKQKDSILAYGEKTGHKHALQAPCLVETDGQQQYVTLNQQNTLVHEDHAWQELQQGRMIVVQQVEVDLLGETRQVLD